MKLIVKTSAEGLYRRAGFVFEPGAQKEIEVDEAKAKIIEADPRLVSIRVEPEGNRKK